MLPYRFILALLLAVVLSWALTAPVEAAPQAFVSASGADRDSETGTENNCGPAWPCRTIGKALTMVDDDGEVVILTSGDYEPFSIRKPVSLIAASGVHAVIIATAGSAITIDTFGFVALRGLTLNGLGGETGINVVSVTVLDIAGCVLNGFSGNAIAFLRGSRFRLRDTILRDNGSDFASAIFINADVRALIDRVRMDHNRHGLVVDQGRVMIRDSVVARQIVHALWVRAAIDTGNPVRLWIENCTITATEMGSGIIAGDPSAPRHWVAISVSNSTVTNNATGVSAHPPNKVFPPDNTSIRVSNTTIALNQTGIDHAGGTAILSRGNNTLEGNANDGSFTWGFSAK
jgi:Right handed beta helix region